MPHRNLLVPTFGTHAGDYSNSLCEKNLENGWSAILQSISDVICCCFLLLEEFFHAEGFSPRLRQWNEATSIEANSIKLKQNGNASLKKNNQKACTATAHAKSSEFIYPMDVMLICKGCNLPANDHDAILQCALEWNDFFGGSRSL